MRDAGFEVIYSGLRQTPEMVVRAAIDEDVDAIGLSILSGAHMTLFPRVMELLKKDGAENILVTGGGIIPEDEMAALSKQGVGRLFGPGTPLRDIVAYIQEEVTKRRSAKTATQENQ